LIAKTSAGEFLLDRLACVDLDRRRFFALAGAAGSIRATVRRSRSRDFALWRVAV
jgi:hypothetical protein